MPERRQATRRPACRAGSAAASQSRTTPARKPCPAGEDSSTSRPPVSPYQPMADPHSSTGGGWSMAASRLASACVPSTRLARISAL